MERAIALSPGAKKGKGWIVRAYRCVFPPMELLRKTPRADQELQRAVWELLLKTGNDARKRIELGRAASLAEATKPASWSAFAILSLLVETVVVASGIKHGVCIHSIVSGAVCLFLGSVAMQIIHTVRCTKVNMLKLARLVRQSGNHELKQTFEHFRQRVELK